MIINNSYTFGKISRSNIKFVERANIDTPFKSKVTTDLNQSSQNLLKVTTDLNQSSQNLLKVNTDLNQSSQNLLKVTTDLNQSSQNLLIF